MNSKTAERLARRLSGAGSRARSAWWAWRRLASAGNAGDKAAIDALWDRWLAEPAPDIWAALLRWRRPCTGQSHDLTVVALGLGAVSEARIRDALVAAAGRAEHPLGQL